MGVSDLRCALLDTAGVPDWVHESIQNGGGQLAPLEEAAALLVWHHPPHPEMVTEALKSAPNVRWVQLPSAGIDRYKNVVTDGSRIWTCAKGVYAEPVAEHALALALAGLRQFTARARTNQWGDETKQTLFDAPVTIIGAGGIAQEFIRLLQPFRSRITVVRRRIRPVSGAEQVVGLGDLDDALTTAVIVLLAAALTPETDGILAASQFKLMKDDAWVVNIARGRLLNQDDLVMALREHWIGGAALDATTPEPLPPDHPLWKLNNCLITPHVAVGHEWGLSLLGRRIEENVRAFREGLPMVGLVDPEAGY